MTLQPETITKIEDHELYKGDVLGVARIAAIQGAKRTSDLVPTVQGALLGAITIDFALTTTAIEIRAQIDARDGLNVEMEALTACMVAALTIYDMCKAVDRSMSIGQVAITSA